MGDFNPTGNALAGFRTSVSDASIIAVCDDGGSETTIDSGVDADGSTLRTLKMVVTGGGASIQFFVDDVSIGSITDDLTAGATLQLGCGTNCAAGATQYTDLVAEFQAWRDAA